MISRLFIVIFFCVFYSEVKSNVLKVIPQPQKVEMLSGSLRWPLHIKIWYSNPEEKKAAELAKEMLLDFTDFSPEVLEAKVGAAESGVYFLPVRRGEGQSYELLVSDNKIKITSTPSGVAPAIATLVQLLNQYKEKDGVVLPGMVITDAPRFS